MRTLSPAAVRRAGTSIVVLSALALALAGAEFLFPDSRVRFGVAVSHWLLSGLVAATGVAVARSKAVEADRPGWNLLLAAVVVGVAGVLFYPLSLTQSSPNPADLCWLSAALVGALGMNRLARYGRRGALLSFLQLAPLAVTAFSLLTTLYWHDVMSSPLPTPAIVTALGYPVFFLFAATVLVQAAVTGAIDVRSNSGLAAMMTGLTIEAIAFTSWAPLRLEKAFQPGSHWLDVLWTVGLVLIGIGAFRARPVEGVPNRDTVVRRRGGVLPTLIFAGLIGIQIIGEFRDWDRGQHLVLSVGVALSGLILAVLLRHTNKLLELESRIDPLTRINNRLRLHEDFEDLAVRSDRYGEAFCLVLLDLDQFKGYNDAYGHQAGDTVLRRVAKILDQTRRSGDRLYRYGGEELLLLLPHQDLEAGRIAGERYRAAVQNSAILYRDNPPYGVVTISVGAAAARPRESPSEVLARADRALYAAKNSGRNRVEVLESEIA